MLLHSQRAAKFKLWLLINKLEQKAEGRFQTLSIYNNLYCIQEDWKCDKIYYFPNHLCLSLLCLEVNGLDTVFVCFVFLDRLFLC